MEVNQILSCFFLVVHSPTNYFFFIRFVNLFGMIKLYILIRSPDKVLVGTCVTPEFFFFLDPDQRMAVDMDFPGFR